MNHSNLATELNHIVTMDKRYCQYILILLISNEFFPSRHDNHPVSSRFLTVIFVKISTSVCGLAKPNYKSKAKEFEYEKNKSDSIFLELDL